MSQLEDGRSDLDAPSKSSRSSFLCDHKRVLQGGQKDQLLDFLGCLLTTNLKFIMYASNMIDLKLKVAFPVVPDWLQGWRDGWRDDLNKRTEYRLTIKASSESFIVTIPRWKLDQIRSCRLKTSLPPNLTVVSSFAIMVGKMNLCPPCQLFP